MKHILKKIRASGDPFWIQDGYGTRFQEFQNLMRYRIRDVLIVSSLYDFYIFEEGGRLYELLRSEYQGLNLSHTPELSRVSGGREALEMIKGDRRFDLIITTLHIEGMRPARFARKVREAGIGIPIVMLAFDNRELAEMLSHREDRLFDHIFIWQGDFRLILAIIKCLEDRMNLEHDTRVMGVQSILLVEDTIRYYSTMLPVLYLEVMKQSQRFIKEGINLSHKNLRQRARPKILLAKTYEEAWSFYQKYHETVLGIISDVDFPREGNTDPEAGLMFAREVRKKHPDIPILLQSLLPENEAKAHEAGCQFLLKNSLTVHQDLRRLMLDHMSFGDFVFHTPDGRVVGRAHDLVTLEKQIKLIPPESFEFHAARNHFSHWLKARTEFWLAYKLRPRKVSDFGSVEETRNHLVRTLSMYRRIRQRGIISDFDRELFDPKYSISRIGGGSLGGKARGLSFFNTIINNYDIQNQFEGVQIFVPPFVVVATDVFDEFLDRNGLREFALETEDDEEILRRFQEAPHFPQKAREDLAAFLELVDKPLAVRSSGLLEDSHVYPFAGVYATYMIPNCQAGLDVRLAELLKAIKRVYASTYFLHSRDYFKATSFLLEEEKMAVIVQILCGSAHGERFYPTLSGTAQSFNFYPVPPQTSSDGIASVALGLGMMVVEGGASVRFSPDYPKHLIQFSNPQLALNNSQHEFFALDLCGDEVKDVRIEDEYIGTYALKDAETDGTLHAVGSTYSSENDMIYEGLSRPGVRLVSFAPILKSEIFPLADILRLLLDMGSWVMGTPVDMEFAADLSPAGPENRTFSLLQIRPMVLTRELEAVRISKVDPERLVCSSGRVMGNGIVEDLRDIILVDREGYDRARSKEVAAEIARFNARLLEERRPYLLIGVGRWGSLDPWLGIPVKWDQIAGARVIVEASFKDFRVDPSLGSHFLENLNSFSVGYFTVSSTSEKDLIDWDWLNSQRPVQSMEFTRHLRFDKGMVVKMNGRKNLGVIYKPGD